MQSSMSAPAARILAGRRGQPALLAARGESFAGGERGYAEGLWRQGGDIEMNAVAP
jgi:hypothetical protein